MGRSTKLKKSRKTKRSKSTEDANVVSKQNDIIESLDGKESLSPLEMEDDKLKVTEVKVKECNSPIEELKEFVENEDNVPEDQIKESDSLVEDTGADDKRFKVKKVSNVSSETTFFSNVSNVSIETNYLSCNDSTDDNDEKIIESNEGQDLSIKNTSLDTSLPGEYAHTKVGESRYSKKEFLGPQELIEFIQAKKSMRCKEPKEDMVSNLRRPKFPR